MDTKQVKKELLEAALAGINGYLKSTRGAAMMGSRADAIVVPQTNIIQVSMKDDRSQLRFFELKVKESLS